VTRFVAIKRLSYDTWRMRSLLILLFCVVAAFVPVTTHAAEQHGQYQGRHDYRLADSGGMSLSQAIESVRRRTGGKVVAAETRVKGGREVHHIKVLTKDGKVKTYKVNGRRR
jgi:uncharacterized membrane protein YkoI